jgi:hypothetical protein
VSRRNEPAEHFANAREDRETLVAKRPVAGRQRPGELLVAVTDRL